MPDDSELAEINPYDLMESEAARLEFYFGSLMTGTSLRRAQAGP